MLNIKSIASIIVKTANYHQIPIEEVFKWIEDEIKDNKNQYCYNYEVKE